MCGKNAADHQKDPKKTAKMAEIPQNENANSTRTLTKEFASQGIKPGSACVSICQFATRFARARKGHGSPQPWTSKRTDP
jgi:hypothetical protein